MRGSVQIGLQDLQREEKHQLSSLSAASLIYKQLYSYLIQKHGVIYHNLAREFFFSIPPWAFVTDWTAPVNTRSSA